MIHPSWALSGELRPRWVFGALLLLAGACAPPPPPPSFAESPQHAVEETLPSSGEAEELRRQLDAQTDFTAQYAEALAGILARLRTMNGEELEVASLIQGEMVVQEVDYPSEIGRRLDELDAILEASRIAANGLRDLLEREGVEATSFQEVMVELARILDEKERAIVALRADLDRLRAEKAALVQRSAALEDSLARESREVERQRSRAEVYEASVEAWALVASPGKLDELRRQGVLRRRWGVLEVDPRALAARTFEQHFRRVDPAEHRVFLPGGVRRAELKSVQEKYPNLFRWGRENGGLSLSILDPAAFWQASRFLVLEAR